MWTTRTRASNYLPDLLAKALRLGTGADAGFVMPSFHSIQAPLDGALAALGPGRVSELDPVRLVGTPGYDPMIVELRRGEFERAARAYWAAAEPRNTTTDALPWNWCRMPPGLSAERRSPATVAVIPAVVAHLAEWLGREIDADPSGVAAIDVVRGVLRPGSV